MSFRCCDYDHVVGTVRKRVFTHRFDIIYRFGPQRANHGCTGNYHMVRQTQPLALNPTNVSLRHIYMLISEIVTLLLYVVSMAFLPEYFGE